MKRREVIAEAQQILHNMEIQRRNRERSFERLEEINAAQLARQGMLADLREEGLGAPENWLTTGEYTRGVPILVRWLLRTENLNVKHGIVHTLQRKEARRIAARVAPRPLLEQFRQLETDLTGGYRGLGGLVGTLKWQIGSTLQYLVNDTVLDGVTDLARDRRHGRTREMIVFALGNMKDPRAVDIAIELLDDDDVAGHALCALRRLNDEKARRHLERFANHPKTWWRNEAKKALTKLDKTRERGRGGGN